MTTISIHTGAQYDIHIGSGLISRLGEFISRLDKIQSVCIVSDTNVFPLYGERTAAALESEGYHVISYVFPAGEAFKNAVIYLELLNFLAENRMTRSDLILALGGGVVGDLAGFAAATYLRGVRYVQMPTTLLAAVDSSVGGKTAIDLPAGKNLAGAFWQPSMVLCDTDTLCTLPEDVFRDGCAEVIKYAILFDPELFALLMEQGMNFDRIQVISRCIRHKKWVVEQDERDTGLRKKLNLGHTIGHGVEARSNYSLSHGKAVSIGMAVVSQAARKLGFCTNDTCAEIIHLLQHFSLPVSTDAGAEELMTYMLKDKKRSGSTLDLILPRSIGHCDIVPASVNQLPGILEAGLAAVPLTR